MSKLFTAFLVIFLLPAGASADVWKWVDAEGETHYVDTMKPIFTWVDDYGKVHYSDTPDHEDAVAVQLFWHAPGTLEDMASGDNAEEGRSPRPGESEAEAAERLAAEEYYCKKATEVYESYLNAPQLYRTNENGEREFLTEEEAKKTIADTRARKDRYCQQG